MTESSGMDALHGPSLQAHELEKVILSLLALAEVADRLADQKLMQLKEISTEIDGSGRGLVKTSERLRLTLLSEIRFARVHEDYLVDLTPLLEDLTEGNEQSSSGVEGLGVSVATLAVLTRQALQAPTSFARRQDQLSRLAALIGLPWPRP